MNDGRKVERATWEGPSWGRLELATDWNEMTLPPIKLPEGTKGRLLLTRESSFEFAKTSGYAVNGDWVSFVAELSDLDEKIYLAGPFSGWAAAIGQKTWELVPQEISGRQWGVLTVKKNVLGGHKLFKFVNGQGIWREPPAEILNAAYENGARNYCIDPTKTGAHAFRFEVEGRLSWKNFGNLVWREEIFEENITIGLGAGFYAQRSASPQGAILEGGKTRFRLFSPRATKVQVCYFREGTGAPACLPMAAEADGCWTGVISQNLEGYSYYYTVEGPESATTSFDVQRRVLDPWALAVKDGHGVVIDKAKLIANRPEKFEVPEMEDIIIAEAHLRDLLAKAPLPLSTQERRGYAGIRKFLEWDENPLRLMGINAVELQPLMLSQGDGDDYRWGYMPISFFAPAEIYASDERRLSQLTELPRMVEAFHEKGIAVILDVVFNHIGVPASALNIDKAYYFRTNLDGSLANCSGCGNDFRIESAMAERLALEALEHWVLAYGVDGFRFDLAELLGANFLKKAEKHLKTLKPNILMIAEPWSFRGHLGSSLKGTDFGSWNDGFREFVPAYLDNKTDCEALKYFIRGCVGSLTTRPVQSINYVESHDDRVWIDKITQNAEHNGAYPTARDRRMTHLMAGLMTMSLGVPMWTVGIEAMRSKYGVNNTYLRGDLNAIDYARRLDFPSTVDYFRGMNAFRRGANGRALRVRELGENYLKFFEAEHKGALAANALGVLYNSEREEAAKRVFYAINPTPMPVRIRVEGLEAKNWVQVADHERIDETGLKFGRFEWREDWVEILPVSCGVWVEK